MKGTTSTDICTMLGGRNDRHFAGRPGNLYAVVGAGPRLIYMSADLPVSLSLMSGKVLEWRPDFIRMQPEPATGPDGVLLSDVTVLKSCWVGAHDTFLTRLDIHNNSQSSQAVEIALKLNGGAGLTSSDRSVRFSVPGVFPTLFREFYGVLTASEDFQAGQAGTEDYVLHVHAGAQGTKTVMVALAFGPNASVVLRAARSGCRPQAEAESTRYWNRLLSREIPQFSCSDPYLQKLYYFRWYSLLTKLNVGGYGRWAKPLAREGTVGFNSLITYSGGPSTLDLRWMRSGSLAYGNVESFFTNLDNGHLANHIYPDRIDDDLANRAPDGQNYPYHNFLTKALLDVYAIHPDNRILQMLWPALLSNASFYGHSLDCDHDGLYDTYPWGNVTGQEFGARFLYLHPYDHLLGYSRDWRPASDEEAGTVASQIQEAVVTAPGITIPHTAKAMSEQVARDAHYRQESVDQNCYAFAEFQALSRIAGILGNTPEADAWSKRAQITKRAILSLMWDPQSDFFYDVAPGTHEKSLVKNPAGFYPFWAGIAGKRYIGLFQHLTNPHEFWTPYPLPTISLDYLKLDGLKKLGWTYWNWNNWPMTTSHVCDAIAQAAEEVDPSLAPAAAELLRRYVKVQFIDGDLARPCVSEYFDPITGAPNAAELDYAHSYFIDLVMRHVVGLDVSPDSNEVRLHPLDMGLEWFRVKGVHVKGHNLDISWSAPGKHRGKGLTVRVDSKRRLRQKGLSAVTISLEPE